MVKKFGKTVNVEVVEGVVADPQLEDARARLVRSQVFADEQLQELKKAERDLHQRHINSLRLVR